MFSDDVVKSWSCLSDPAPLYIYRTRATRATTHSPCCTLPLANRLQSSPMLRNDDDDLGQHQR